MSVVSYEITYKEEQMVVKDSKNEETTKTKDKAFIEVIIDEEAKKEVEEVHKNTRDSIEYASLIQQAIIPDDKQVKSFFDKIGTTVEIKNERLSKNFWATSAMMAPFYEILKVLSDWLVKRGIKRKV